MFGTAWCMIGSMSHSRGVVLEVHSGGLTGLYGSPQSYFLGIPSPPGAEHEALPVLCHQSGVPIFFPARPGCHILIRVSQPLRLSFSSLFFCSLIVGFVAYS